MFSTEISDDVDFAERCHCIIAFLDRRKYERRRYQHNDEYNKTDGKSFI